MTPGAGPADPGIRLPGLLFRKPVATLPLLGTGPGGRPGPVPRAPEPLSGPDRQRHSAGEPMLNAKKVLVIAAHPDDEVLGCGGALARLTAAGATGCILLLGEGPTSRLQTGDTAGAEQARGASRHAAKAAAETLGVRDLRFANFPDNAFDSVPLLQLVQAVETVAEEVRPDLVFTHHAGDLNIDHVLTHRAVLTAFRPLPGTPTLTLLGFEVASSTEYTPPGTGPAFQPTLFVDVADFLGAKQKALAAYAGEMRPWPHPRSVEGVDHLARLRGCQCGREAAEAFMVYRSLQ